MSKYKENASTGQVLQLLTIPAVAQALHVSRPTVYVLISNHSLSVIRLGRSASISLVSLQERD